MIRRITPEWPPCFGVDCPHHSACARYAAVDGRDASDAIGTCVDGGGNWPHFVSRLEVVANEQTEGVAA